MEVQTLSVVVPAGCPNRCRFCVSKLHDDGEYENQIEKNRRFKHLYRNDYIKRLSFARDNGCNTIIYTGDGEPITNLSFLENAAEWNRGIDHPFRWMELQTSGVTLDDGKLRWLREEIEVSTISLSLSSVFLDAQNADYNRTPEALRVGIDSLCAEIRRYDFNLRLSLNMTDFYDNRDPGEIFSRVKALGANQVTFRVLYSMDSPRTEQEKEIDSWIAAHRASERIITAVREHVQARGRRLERLPFGAVRYAVDGISTVIDEDCMSVEAKEALKYLILRPNCKLYTKWDDAGSLLF
jgi:sulfatase maturation enzyme AslB (radical SAM superfamily)